MPLLPLEPFLHPADLLSGERGGAGTPSDERCWWVLHTRPRAEKCLARRLLDRDISFFLPLHSRHWSNQGRHFCSHVPLFAGYVFLFGDAQARWEALRTNLIAHVLPVRDQQRLEADLERVHQLMTSRAELRPEERLAPGTAVEIVSGPLAGLEGKVIRQGGQLRFLVEVEFLRRGVSVEVEHWMVQPVHDRRTLSAGVACG